MLITNVKFFSYNFTILSNFQLPFFLNETKMELELGLKLTNIADDLGAVELQIAKNRAGPLFLCTQTESMFFITAHLKGYRRKNIKIDINDDGSIIEISGEKPVQEMVMVGWQVLKKGLEMIGFKKVFNIPRGVNLDEIKARFDEDESILTISMPKLVKGVTVVGIEEIKEPESLQVVSDDNDLPDGLDLRQEESSKPEEVQEIDQRIQNVPEHTRQELETKEVQDIGSNGSELKKEEGEKGHNFREPGQVTQPKEVEPVQATQPKELPSVAPDLEEEKEAPRSEKVLQEKGTQTDKAITRDIQEKEIKPEYDRVEPICLKPASEETQAVHDQEVVKTEQIIPEEKEADDIPYSGEKEKKVHDDQSTDKDHRRKSKKICNSGIIVGSSLLASLLVLVLHLIRSNSQRSKKKS